MVRVKPKFWFVAQTHQSSENEAKLNLRAQEFEVEYPLYQLPRNSKGVRAVKPLFEGYVFVRMCERWRSINGTRGVRNLILNGITPSRIADADLQYFRDCEDDYGYYVDPDKRKLRPGDSCAPASGRFRGIYGEFLRMTSHARCEVLYQLLGQPVVSQHLYADLR